MSHEAFLNLSLLIHPMPLCSDMTHTCRCDPKHGHSIQPRLAGPLPGELAELLAGSTLCLLSLLMQLLHRNSHTCASEAAADSFVTSLINPVSSALTLDPLQKHVL